MLPWAWIQSLVGKLRSHKPRSVAKKKKNLVGHYFFQWFHGLCLSNAAFGGDFWLGHQRPVQLMGCFFTKDRFATGQQDLGLGTEEESARGLSEEGSCSKALLQRRAGQAQVPVQVGEPFSGFSGIILGPLPAFLSHQRHDARVVGELSPLELRLPYLPALQSYNYSQIHYLAGQPL